MNIIRRSRQLGYLAGFTLLAAMLPLTNGHAQSGPADAAGVADNAATGPAPSQKHCAFRTPDPGDPLFAAFDKTYRSIEAAELFIREHPSERDLCAGARLNVAGELARQGKKKEAVEAYQKVADECGDEIVPYASHRPTVANAAHFRIAQLERDMGHRERALEILGKLMTSEDSNTRTSSRFEYLATKQSHLKVTAKVTVQGEGPFAVGTRIPVVVSVGNPTAESVTFTCYATIEHNSYRAAALGDENHEITLAAGAKRDVPMVFAERETKRLVPGTNQLKVGFGGIPFEASALDIEIKGTDK